MKPRFFHLTIFLALLGACSFPPSKPAATPTSPPEPDYNWSRLLGKKVTLEGKALDAKSGALLRGETFEIWIDGLTSWPEGLYEGGERGKLVRVQGTVTERSDLPAYHEKEGESPKAGMPVASEQDVASAQKRYFLKDATWVEVESTAANQNAP